MTIRRIRKAIRQGHYEFSAHSLEEMDEDNLTDADVRRTVLGGALVTELTDDPRGVRFVVCGVLKDQERDVEVVCRFLPSGMMRIITVYEVDE